MDSKKPIYKSIPFWIMVLFLLYSALGFLAVPYILEKKITEIISSDLNSQLDIDKISFNPYSFSTTIENIKLTDADEQLWFSADEIFVNLGLVKTLFGNTNLAEISLSNPHYYLHIDNINNSTQLKYPQLSEDKSSAKSELALDIENININQGTLSYLDTTSDRIVQLKFKKIGFNHVDFTTDDYHSNFDLSVITDNNDEISFSGAFNFSQLSSKGSWKLNNFSTETIFKFITDKNLQFYGFINQDGLITANGEYLFDSKNQSLPSFLIHKLKLENFKAQSADQNQPTINISKLKLDESQIDLDKKLLKIKLLDIQDSELNTHFLENNALLWDVINDTNSQKVQPETPDTSSIWHYQIDQINTDNTIIVLNKHKNNEIVKNSIVLTTTSVTNLTNQQGNQTTFKMTVTPDVAGTILVKATAQLEPFKIDSEIDAAQINLVSWQAWLPNDINMTIKQGLLSLHQKISLSEKYFNSNGWINFKNLDLLDKNKQTFFKVKELKLAENQVDSTTKTITLSHIMLDEAEGNLSVSPESQLNINSVISDQQEKQKIKDTKDDWIIKIDQVELINLQTNFIDRSIKPNYQSKLSKVNGTIKGLSSANTSKADLEIKGVLDTYGQFDIKGKINPLSDTAYTDLAINIKNLELQNFSTYSSKFIGFPISRGKADFILNYKLNQNLLKGINDIEFKQLQLGEKINSENAINLPLKLAIALLTDGKGVMAINLPVSGRVDDPEFSYGGLVFKAFFKLITGIVASPFKLLGKLIPNGADLDLSGIQFKAGTAVLVQGEEEKLKAMQSILSKRPSLMLELISTINTIEDSKAIKNAMLLKELNLDLKPDFTDINLLKRLKTSYIKLIDSEKWQELETKANQEGILNHALLAEDAWNQLLNYFSEQAKNQLSIIAKTRAQNIQQKLIEKYKIAESRIFLKTFENSDNLPPQVKFGMAN